MGKKVNPIAMRPNFKYAVWFTNNKKCFKNFVEIDYRIRQLALNVLGRLNFAQIGIERIGKNTIITIHTHKAAFIVSKDGNNTLPLIEKYKNKIKEKILQDTPFSITINDKVDQDSDPNVIAPYLANCVENRMNYKTVTKKVISNFMRKHYDGGIKIIWTGRINSTEIARKEKFQEGKMPLSTIREKIDFSYWVSNTNVGTVTCRVFVYIPPQENAKNNKIEKVFNNNNKPNRSFNNNYNKNPFEKFDKNNYRRFQKNNNVNTRGTLGEKNTAFEQSVNITNEINNKEIA